MIAALQSRPLDLADSGDESLMIGRAQPRAIEVRCYGWQVVDMDSVDLLLQCYVWLGYRSAAHARPQSERPASSPGPQLYCLLSSVSFCLAAL